MKTKVKTIELKDEEWRELKLVQNIVTNKELDLRLAKHGLQNILKNICKAYKLNPDKTAFDIVEGTLTQS